MRSVNLMISLLTARYAFELRLNSWEFMHGVLQGKHTMKMPMYLSTSLAAGTTNPRFDLQYKIFSTETCPDTPRYIWQVTLYSWPQPVHRSGFQRDLQHTTCMLVYQDIKIQARMVGQELCQILSQHFKM